MSNDPGVNPECSQACVPSTELGVIGSTGRKHFLSISGGGKTADRPVDCGRKVLIGSGQSQVTVPPGGPGSGLQVPECSLPV